jgi:hypothetical protein
MEQRCSRHDTQKLRWHTDKQGSNLLDRFRSTRHSSARAHSGTPRPALDLRRPTNGQSGRRRGGSPGGSPAPGTSAVAKRLRPRARALATRRSLLEQAAADRMHVKGLPFPVPQCRPGDRGCQRWVGLDSGLVEGVGYLRDPRWGFFNCVCRTFVFLRLGLLITKVPLPRYSALNSLSSAKGNSPESYRFDPSLYRALCW